MISKDKQIYVSYLYIPIGDRNSPSFCPSLMSSTSSLGGESLSSTLKYISSIYWSTLGGKSISACYTLFFRLQSLAKYTIIFFFKIHLQIYIHTCIDFMFLNLIFNINFTIIMMQISIYIMIMYIFNGCILCFFFSWYISFSLYLCRTSSRLRSNFLSRSVLLPMII